MSLTSVLINMYLLVMNLLHYTKLPDNGAFISERVCKLLGLSEVQVISVALLSQEPHNESVITETVTFENCILPMNTREYCITSSYPLKL